MFIGNVHVCKNGIKLLCNEILKKHYAWIICGYGKEL